MHVGLAEPVHVEPAGQVPPSLQESPTWRTRQRPESQIRSLVSQVLLALQRCPLPPVGGGAGGGRQVSTVMPSGASCLQVRPPPSQLLLAWQGSFEPPVPIQ